MEDFFIPVHIDPENKNPTYTQYVYQWDYGLYLKITGVDIPNNTPVAFSNHDVCGNALRMIATTSDGVTIVKIPDILLAEQEFCFGNLSVYAWITLVGESGSKTIYKIVIPVHSRPKPEDYTDPGTDDPFADTIEQVKQYADQAEQSAADAETARNGAEKAYQDTIDAVDQIKEDQISMAEKIAIKPTATGTDIVAEDSTDWRLLDLSAQGWTEQVQTEGNQLFDASKLPTKSQGGATVTNNEDGSFTISGEGNLTETFSHGYDYTHSDLVNFFREGKLYLDVGVITTPYVYFNVKKQGQNLINANNELREKVEVTITKEILDDPETTFRIGFYGTQGSEITPQIIYPMLYQDGDGAWEPYGTVEAWPQPIVSAAEDAKTEEGEYPVTFSIIGKNLINFYKYYNSFSGSDGYEGSANEINQIKINLPKSLIGKQVCFSAKIKISGNLTGSYVYAITGGIGKCGNIIRNKNVFEISKVIFTPKTEEDTIHITYGTNGANTVYFKDLMLNLGEEAGFEPYKNPQTVTITSDRPLTKWDRLEKREGKWGWSYRSENVVYDGSTDENWIANESAGTNAFSIFNGNTIYNTIFCNKLKRYVGAVSQIPYGSIQEVSLLIILKIENIASVDELRSWMAENPLNIWHEISNEEWVELSPEEQDALNALTTYYPTTVFQNDAGMEMTVRYVADPENYLRKNYQKKLEQVDTLAGQVATLQEYIIKEV